MFDLMKKFVMFFKNHNAMLTFAKMIIIVISL